MCDAYTAHSDEAREAIIKTYKIRKEKLHIVPHGPYNMYGSLDKDTVKKELNLSGFTVLYFGMIRQYKGVPTLIKAFDQILVDSVNRMHLVIAGENWGDDPELLPALSNSHYRDRIVFQPEFLSDDMVSKYFAAADVVVLPYLRTCGSGVLNIAMAQGKPIITTDLGTMRESLKNYDGASFFPVGDSYALQKKIFEIYKCWQANDLKYHTNSELNWSKIAKQYEQIIERLAI